MRIEILVSAQDDLIAGYNFYENRSQGLGNYFLDSLFSDIDSLRLFAGIHSVHSDAITGCCPSGFPSLSTIESRGTWRASMRFSTVVEIPMGLPIA